MSRSMSVYNITNILTSASSFSSSHKCGYTKIQKEIIAMTTKWGAVYHNFTNMATAVHAKVVWLLVVSWLTDCCCCCCYSWSNQPCSSQTSVTHYTHVFHLLPRQNNDLSSLLLLLRGEFLKTRSLAYLNLVINNNNNPRSSQLA